MADAFDPQLVYDRAFADGMRAAAEARCADCAEGAELYFGFSRSGGSGLRQWRHEGHNCRCGAWQIWDDMVRRGMIPEPERWEGEPTHATSASADVCAHCGRRFRVTVPGRQIVCATEGCPARTDYRGETREVGT